MTIVHSRAWLNLCADAIASKGLPIEMYVKQIMFKANNMPTWLNWQSS